MGAFKNIAIEIMEAEEKLGRDLSQAERDQIQNQYIQEQNEIFDQARDEVMSEICEQCEEGVLHSHGMPTLEEVYGIAMKVKDEPYYDICETTVNNGEAVFEVAFHEDEKYDTVTIEATFEPYADEDEAYGECIAFYIHDTEVDTKKHARLLKKYSKLVEKMSESIDEWCADKGHEIWSERMQAAADHAYDCWKDDQAERGE